MLSNLFDDAEVESGPRLFAEVVFDRPLDQGYTYLVPADLHAHLAVGKRVLAPFGKGNHPLVGFCVGMSGLEPEAPVSASGRKRAYKQLLQVLDEEALLTEGLMQLTRWMADYYLCSWGQVLNAIVPGSVKRQAGTRVVTVVGLKDPERWPDPLPPLSAKQKTILALLRDGPLDVREVQVRVDCRAGPIKGLLHKGLLARTSRRVEQPARAQEPLAPLHRIPELTADQRTAWAALEPALRSGGFHPFLLYGVTGSGKTEIYLRAIDAVVQQGKEALVLVPEISLTPQTIAAFQGRGHEVAILHSNLQGAERGLHWRRIAKGVVPVIVGARSAVFAPTRRLGLIVIDEEHESSFKQDATPRYHGRDVAIMRARIEQIPIILGSATPSLESWHNAQKGQYTLLTLPTRVQSRPLPPVRIIDLRHDRPIELGNQAISPSLEHAMRAALHKQEQVLLLLNRRGFSTYLHCPGCGYVQHCRFCDLAMTYHRERDTILCHFCGYEQAPPTRCPTCGTGQVRYQGMGTEKLHAEIASRFSDYTVERMDSDTMKKPGSHQRVLRAFRDGKIQILLGTQMIAKGLDFPNVTIVGVINADVGLHHADFRAAERTFQLLAQVAGRAGRGERDGAVYIQTFSPEHPSIALAARHDYLQFAAEELKQRQAHRYPPFQRMARLIVRSKEETKARDEADRLAGAFRQALEQRRAEGIPPAELRLLGPAEAPVFRLKGYYRFHFQLHSLRSDRLHALMREVLPSVKPAGGVERTIDIDPQDLL